MGLNPVSLGCGLYLIALLSKYRTWKAERKAVCSGDAWKMRPWPRDEGQGQPIPFGIGCVTSGNHRPGVMRRLLHPCGDHPPNQSPQFMRRKPEVPSAKHPTNTTPHCQGQRKTRKLRLEKPEETFRRLNVLWSSGWGPGRERGHLWKN